MNREKILRDLSFEMLLSALFDWMESEDAFSYTADLSTDIRPNAAAVLKVARRNKEIRAALTYVLSDHIFASMHGMGIHGMRFIYESGKIEFIAEKWAKRHGLPPIPEEED